MVKINVTNKELKSLVKKVKSRFDEKSIDRLSTAVAVVVAARSKPRDRSEDAKTKNPKIGDVREENVLKSPHPSSSENHQKNFPPISDGGIGDGSARFFTGASKHPFSSSDENAEIKRRLLGHASSGMSRPDVPGGNFDADLARALVSICSPWGPQFDPEFANALNAVRPDWFRLTLAPIKQFLPHVELSSADENVKINR